MGSASVFSVSANGSLCSSPACVQQTQGIVADARAALRVSPELRFKWVLGGTKESFRLQAGTLYAMHGSARYGF